MKISLLTDAPKHNLALMKMSAWFKANGDTVTLNQPIMPHDLQYGSWLFGWHPTYKCDDRGGPIYPHKVLPPKWEAMKPDYELFKIDYSLGYTWRDCSRGCKFCQVPKMPQEKIHHSIWEFHDSKFKKICLLNNNTLSDPRWRETFNEIRDAKLIVVDQNGYDLRLMDEEKAAALKRTKFQGYIHYAWDRMQDEKKIIEGLKIAPKGMVYVLIGFDTTQEEDFYRCQIITNLGHDPYVMPYNGGTKQQRRFKRFIDSRMYRKYKTIQEAWNNYKA